MFTEMRPSHRPLSVDNVHRRVVHVQPGIPLAVVVQPQQFAPVVRLKIPIDTATGLRATVDTPGDRIQIIEISPEEASEYLPAGAG